MKECTKILRKGVERLSERTRLTGKEVAEIAASHLFFALCGFFAARGVVLDKYLPFGIAAAAGCPYPFLPAVSVGVLSGSFFAATGTGSFRYLAATFAVLAIRLLVSRMEKVAKQPLFSALVGFLSVFFVGVASLSFLSGGVPFALVEAVLAGGGAYFVHRGLISLINSETGLSGEQLASVILTVNFVLLGLCGITVGGISIGRLATVTLILVAARYGNVGAGAVFGICCALTAALTGSSTAVTVMLAFGGLMAGVFADTGKLGETFAFLAASVIGALMGGFGQETVGVLVESVLGSAVWLFLPKSAAVRFGKLFSGRVAVVKPDGLKKGLTMRLRFASTALGDVSATVDNVAKELSKINSPDFRQVLCRIENDACKGCSLQIYCWETRYDETLAAVIDMTKGVKKGECMPEKFCTTEFRGRCLRASVMGNAAYKHYSEYAARVAAEQRVGEIRSVVADQFSGISQMLNTLADEFDTDERFDASAASRIAAALKNINVLVTECGVRLDKNDRMSVEIRMKSRGDTVLNRASIMRALCVACDRDFDPPCISVGGDEVFLSACEHAVYTAEIGVNQICSGDAAVCGDAYEYFFDGKGKLIMVLSDGMGTGGRAAVDGAMASGLMTRLLKAGFGFDAALKILNSSMLFKSTDESTATVDIVAVDLFTGKTELFKAGAAPTLVRRGGKAGKAQSSSLPAGILRNVNFDRAVVTLRRGDIVLLLSDGAVSEGTDWISSELESWGDGGAQALAQRISECAKRRRTDRHEDDITVLAAILQKAS